MLNRIIICKLNILRRYSLNLIASQSSNRLLHDEFVDSFPRNIRIENDTKEVSPNIATKYKPFQDDGKNVSIILDVEEERSRLNRQSDNDAEVIDDTVDVYVGLNVKRGITGVFDIEDLVTVLRRENALDLVVCSVPSEIKYVDYICICTGRSFRHMKALAQFVRKMYKVKRLQSESIPKIEGENSRDWMAIDLGNIALHIFSTDARQVYDLESLWSVGKDYDWESNKPTEELIELYEKHTMYLADLQPKINPQNNAVN